MKGVFLLTMFVCRGMGGGCPDYFDVYETQAQCDIALSKWKESSGWFFASGIRNGFCFRRDLTDADIATYKSRKP